MNFKIVYKNEQGSDALHIKAKNIGHACTKFLKAHKDKKLISISQRRK